MLVYTLIIKNLKGIQLNRLLCSLPNASFFYVLAIYKLVYNLGKQFKSLKFKKFQYSFNLYRYNSIIKNLEGVQLNR